MIKTFHFSLKATLLAVSLAFLGSFATAEPLMNGLATHTELGKEQFIAALLTETLTPNSRDVLLADEPKQIQVRVTANRLSSRRFKRMWIEGMAINASPAELEKQAQNMADFSNLIKIKMAAGDIFSISRDYDTVKVVLNGVQLGEIESTQFFDLLLRAWIGPVPLSSEFRAALVANGKVDNKLRARFDATLPSDGRITSIEGLIQARDEAAKSEQSANRPSAPNIALSTTKIAPTVTPPTFKAKIAQPPSIDDEGESETVVAAQPQAPSIESPAAPKKVEPKPQVQLASAAPQAQLFDAAELEEDDDDENFTAESLLEQQLYIAKLKRWSGKYMRYPSRSLSLEQEGTVRLSVTIDREGKVQDIQVIDESEHSALTRAAKKGAKRASPFPPIPEKMKGDDFSFSLPVVFRLN